MVNPELAHLKSMILLARQSREDLRLISDDGREVFGHKIVVSIFSKFMTDLFLCQDKDETMITLTVPVNFDSLKEVIQVMEGGFSGA